MIQANELRIGNWLNHHGKFPFQMTLSEFYDLQSGVRSLEYTQPIPLTPEILEKAGFEETGEGEDQFFHKEEKLFGLSRRWDISIEGKEYSHIWDGSFTGRTIKYVHELQNLYFALTGTELNINLP